MLVHGSDMGGIQKQHLLSCSCSVILAKKDEQNNLIIYIYIYHYCLLLPCLLSFIGKVQVFQPAFVASCTCHICNRYLQNNPAETKKSGAELGTSRRQLDRLLSLTRNSTIGSWTWTP